MSHTIANFSPRSPMWLFEENFRLLQRLLPDVAAGDYFAFHDEHDRKDVDIEVVERCRYTVTLAVTKYFGRSGRILPDLSMKVRVYYDAHVAEVMSYQNCRTVPSRYGVDPSDIRFRKDEKRQVNKLLHDLLRYCAGRGYRPVTDSRCTSV